MSDLDEYLSDIFVQIVAIFEDFKKAVQEQFEYMRPIFEDMWKEIEKAYKDDGSPYGESREGIYQWLEDLKGNDDESRP